jgi:hypothetical protein
MYKMQKYQECYCLANAAKAEVVALAQRVGHSIFPQITKLLLQ